MVSQIIIGGTTGSGKSKIAIKIAKILGGSILCGDSQQVYKNNIIATNSNIDNVKKLNHIIHYGFNNINNKIKYNAGKFITLTNIYIKICQNNKKIPIIVGGSGMYLKLLKTNFTKPTTPKNNITKEFINLFICKNKNYIKTTIKKQNTKLYKNDTIRFNRFIENLLLIKNKKLNKNKKSFFFLLKPTKKEIKHKLKTRLNNLFMKKLLLESLIIKKKYGKKYKLLELMGYKQILAFFSQESCYKCTKKNILTLHYNYSKKQNKWFKRELWWNILKKKTYIKIRILKNA